MNTIYRGYSFTITPNEPATEILIAQLGMVGFESFVETEDGLLAYIQEQDWQPNILNDIQILKSDEFLISYQQEVIEQQNWNKEWEKNFHQIQVDGIVSIRAPFHENPQLKYDIVIEPKMSFGTGHHETTHMMIQHLISLDLKNKTVLDMGCGTGILAIFADMKGATSIEAIDIDNWCYENSIENVQRNNCSNIRVYEGDAVLLNGKKYDVIIANINRNILLNDIKTYVSCLNDGGILLLSGFYHKDISVINNELLKYGMKRSDQLERNEWIALKYLK